MKRKVWIITLIITMLLLISLACSAQWQMQSDAATQAAGSMRATLTAIFVQTATKQYEEEQNIPTQLPTPTCALNIYGVCIALDQQSVLGTQLAMLDNSSSREDAGEWNELFRAKVKGNVPIPIYSEPGVGESIKGMMFPYEDFPVGRDVSGFINGQMVEGHYYGVRLTCWMELIDINEKMSKTAGIKHEWEHPLDTRAHSHCQTKNGVLIAQIWPGVNILEVSKVDKERELAKVILEIVWIDSVNVNKE